MRTRLLTVLAMSALMVGGTATPALAKGPDRVVISGPELTTPITIDGAGEPGSADLLGVLADGSGLFLAMFGPSGGGGELLATRPAGALGPRYTLVYRVPNGNPQPASITQDLYPYAADGPVTYTRPGQFGFTGQKALGGWHPMPDSFGALLVRIGLPRASGDRLIAASPTPGPVPAAAPVTAPAPAGRHRSAPWYLVPVLVALVGSAAVGLFAVYRRRARSAG